LFDLITLELNVDLGILLRRSKMLIQSQQ